MSARPPLPHLTPKKPPPVVGSGQLDAEFSKLKSDAFALLDWAMQDISPDAAHHIHMKTGIEREVTCVPPELIAEPIENQVLRFREQAENELRQRHPEGMERFYRDLSAPMLLELTTRPQSPEATVETAKRLEADLRDIGNRQHFQTHFATAPATPDLLEHCPEMLGQQVFQTPEGDHVLLGQGSHANASLWAGDKNLFYLSPYEPKKGQLGYAVVNEAIRLMPGMVLPTRRDNYWDIQAGAFSAIRTIGAGYNEKSSRYGLNWVDHDSDNKAAAPQRTRLEFRQGTSDAKPEDLVLTAEIPLVRALLGHAQLTDKGKACFDERGALILDPQKPVQAVQENPMPRSLEEAKAAFNPEGGNPNFRFLDELAQRKIDQLTAAGGGHLEDAALREAEKLRNIGTKLHQHYCREYGMESRMTLPPTAHFASV